MANTAQLVSELQSTASGFVQEVSNQSQKVHTALDKIDKTVNGVNKKIVDLRTKIIEGEQEQIAHENILKINQEINSQLAPYQTVRRSVIGVIKDFDINLARNSTIAKLSQELWMSTSRYWLSYAFIGICAWIQDDRELCSNAVAEAVRRDANKTSLFFCLLNLRFGRHLEARSWLYEYFGSVEAVHPPRETALLLQAYLFGVFGRDSQLDDYVQNMVESWITELGSDAEISAGLVGDYSKYVNSLPSDKWSYTTNVLDEHCSNLAEINSSLVNASRYKAVLKRVDELDEIAEFNCGDDFVKSIDKLLDDLVTNYDEEELRLEKEKKFYELVMEHKGDVESAKKQYAVYMEGVKDAPNIGEQMFRWAVYPKGVDKSVQKFAVQKTKDWFVSALNAYDHDVKSSAPGTFKLKIYLWEDTTDGKDREAVEKGLRDKFNAERSKLLVFTKFNIVSTVIAVVALILGCVIGMTATFYGYIAGAGLFVVLALIVVLTTVAKFKGFPKRIQRAVDTLYACLDELEGYREAFEKMTAVKEEVVQKLVRM